MTVVDMLKKATVKEIPSPGPIVTIKSNENPRDAYKKLVDANIRSAPMIDVRSGKYVGFLDIRDLIAFIVFEAKEADAKVKAAHAHKPTDRLKHEYMDTLINVGAKMYDQPLDGVSLLYLSRRHGFHAVNDAASLDEVAQLLVRKHCHRVAVVNAAGEVINVVSQSSIVKYLDDHKAELGPVGAHTVARSGCGTSPVLCVKTSDTVLHAFQLMADHDVMGIAVVDEGGHLIANTSASDLKQFLRDPSTSLKLPVVDFVSRVRQSEVLKEIHPAISVRPSDTLAHVIGKLAAARVHRVFVVGDGKLMAVISLSDIMRYVYHVAHIAAE